MSQSRQDFLKWHFSEVDRIAEQISDEAAAEFNESVEERWPAWQASRAGIVIVLPSPYAVIGDYAACGGGRAVWDNAYAEKIEDRMCEKTPVYDKASLESAGVRVQS